MLRYTDIFRLLKYIHYLKNTHIEDHKMKFCTYSVPVQQVTRILTVMGTYTT